jgi:ParB family transcriptional regulator, chromosome partitioning protein
MTEPHESSTTNHDGDAAAADTPDPAAAESTENETRADTADGADIDAGGDGAAAGVGELAWADPRTLIVGVNVRGDVALDRGFVRDIAARGVREPITVRRRGEDGALVVRKGKRRTLGAIEAGCSLVRVFIEPEPDVADTDPTGQVERIIDQLGENHHRAATTELDEVRAHQQLLDLGLKAGEIARRTHVPAKRVKATTAVAGSAVAAAVLARYHLTLDQAADIAAFDDGTDAGTEAVKALTVTAQQEPDQFAHVAQQLRDRAQDAALHQARVDELTAAGAAILPDLDTLPADAPRPARLWELRPTAQDPSGTELTETAHRGCPGHAAAVAVHRHWREGAQVRTEWWCLDPAGNGHPTRWDRPAGAGGTGPGSGREPGPMSEQEKAERRRVVANNKAWDSATTVRRKWLREFLARKSAPRDAGAYIAATLAVGGHDVRKAMEASHPTACALLGLGAPGGYGTPSPLLGALEGAGGARTTMISLAVLLGAAEDGTSRNSWRSPTGDTRRYFAQLHAWGYPLAPVEQLVNNPDADRDDTADAGGADTGDDADGGSSADGGEGVAPGEAGDGTSGEAVGEDDTTTAEAAEPEAAEPEPESESESESGSGSAA